MEAQVMRLTNPDRLRDRALGALMGAFVGDALGVGPHWYYDLDALRHQPLPGVRFEERIVVGTDRWSSLARPERQNRGAHDAPPSRAWDSMPSTSSPSALPRARLCSNW